MIDRINEKIEKYKLFKFIAEKVNIDKNDSQFYELICFFHDIILSDLEELKKLAEEKKC